MGFQVLEAIYLCVALAVALLVYKIYMSFRKPHHFRHIKAISPMTTFSNLRNKVSPFERYHKDLRPLIEKDNDNFVLNWFGRWVLVALTPEAAKKYYQDIGRIQKEISMETRPGSTIGHFMGKNLVFTNGDEWKKLRRAMNPAFTVDNLKTAVPVFQDCAKQFINHIGKTLNQDVEIHNWTQRFTLEALGRASFGYKFRTMEEDESQWVEVYNSVVRRLFQPLRFMLPFTDRMKTKANIALHNSIDEFQGFLLDIVMEKKKKLEGGATPENPDLVDLLLTGSEGELTDDDLKYNMVIFFLAGHDTTSASLSSVFFHLAHNPDVQEKVLKEILEVTGDDEEITFEQQAKLDYCTWTIKEALRHVPPVPGLPMRITSEDTEIEGLKIPAGTRTTLNIYALHMDPKTWGHDVDKFRPERFSPEESKGRHPYAWCPFGGGGRLCIGYNFSLIEQRVLLAMFLKKYKVVPSPDCNKFKITPAGLVVPIDLRVRFEKR